MIIRLKLWNREAGSLTCSTHVDQIPSQTSYNCTLSLEPVNEFVCIIISTALEENDHDGQHGVRAKS